MIKTKGEIKGSNNIISSLIKTKKENWDKMSIKELEEKIERLYNYSEMMFSGAKDVEEGGYWWGVTASKKAGIYYLRERKAIKLYIERFRVKKNN